MKDVIMKELHACERANDVRVLYAVESGSRCWGFESADSDYDVRFVYVRPAKDYLRLDEVRDTIDWRLDDELDIVGWDLKKFLKLMRASNPQVFEWLESEICYHVYRDFACVYEFEERCFNPVANSWHYLGMAKKHDARYIRNGNVCPKRYLYCMRGILAARWVISEQKPVPMAFETLKEAMLEPEMVPLADELVKVKRQELEKQPCDRNLELENWILAQLEALEQEIKGLEPSVPVSWDDMNELFRKILM